MKISEIQTDELKRMLKATERTLGQGAVEVRILRRELAKREKLKAQILSKTILGITK